jgi:hypothetical protein
MRQATHRIGTLVLLSALSASALATAQDSPTPALAAPTASVTVLPVVLYTGQANVQEASDTAMAALADSVLTGTLAKLLGTQFISPASGGFARHDALCGAVVGCARAVAQSVGAAWVVLAKVSKTSNLIWLFTGQLIHVPDGTIVLDDSTELKGEPEGMVRAGTRIFAERVTRTVRAGGVTTNFPNGVPGAPSPAGSS